MVATNVSSTGIVIPTAVASASVAAAMMPSTATTSSTAIGLGTYGLLLTLLSTFGFGGTTFILSTSSFFACACFLSVDGDVCERV
ncbi:MAG: hypothetical protein L6R36_002788 [Xanthoria steineri]|nr:MAG: hypothetical protein L6R36_002788 [Xanthoria steineri]